MPKGNGDSHCLEDGLLGVRRGVVDAVNAERQWRRRGDGGVVFLLHFDLWWTR